jgi:hypothetical protein
MEIVNRQFLIQIKSSVMFDVLLAAMEEATASPAARGDLVARAAVRSGEDAG